MGFQLPTSTGEFTGFLNHQRCTRFFVRFLGLNFCAMETSQLIGVGRNNYLGKWAKNRISKDIFQPTASMYLFDIDLSLKTQNHGTQSLMVIGSMFCFFAQGPFSG